MPYKCLRDELNTLTGSLQTERSSFTSTWREVLDYISPTRGRFQITDNNRGDRRNRNIIDSTGAMASRTLASGMQSNITSAARPWFRLTTPDPELAEFSAVKDWLFTVGTRMSNIFLKSNLYQALPIVYRDMGDIGTGCFIFEEDTFDILRAYVMPVGSYCLANDERGRASVFQREFRMTVRQVVSKFGKPGKDGKPDMNMFSTQVKNAWDNSNYEMWVDICHIIMPNKDYNPRLLESRFKKYASYYFERGMGSEKNPTFKEGEEGMLSVKGYDFFPVLAPRWGTSGDEVYATSCPGIDCIGDVKALQLMHRRKAQAIDKMVNPAMVGPSVLKNTRSSIASGDITYLDSTNPNADFRPAHIVNINLNDLRLDINEHQARIKEAYYVDLFLMLANLDRSQITAREVDVRQEEKLVALGPVLEQLNQDCLDPMIDIAYEVMDARGMIPQIPQELNGIALKVEYISIMAAAQKTIGIGGINQFMSFAGSLVGVFPTIVDKVDADQALDVMGDMLSVVPGIVRTDEAVQKIRDDRAKAAQQQQQQQEQAQLAASAKTLSETHLDGNTALNQLLGQDQGAQA